MSRRSSSTGVLAVVLFLIVGLGFVRPAFPQSGPPPLPKNLKFPRPSGLPAVQQEEVLSYWTTETGWTSELELRDNSLLPLTVTPVLRLTDGTETPLAATTIQPEEAKSVDIAQSIATASASQLLGSYGSVALRYVSPSQASLYAAMVIRRPGHPTVFHVDASGNSESMQSGGSQGIWWLPKSTTDGYFVITNLGTHTVPVALSIFDSAGRESRQNLSLPEHQTFRFSIRALVQTAGFSGSYGGIRVSTNAHAGSLDTLAFLYDDAAGFGAILKMFGYDPKAQLAERDYARTGQWTLRAPMLALSTPDPSLAFPPGTQLHPLLFISNVTGKTIAAALRFNWRAGNATGKAVGPTLQLAPYQTQQVDVAAMQKSGAIPPNANWALVTLTTNSLPDEVVAIASSYTDTLRYGAQTPFNDQMTYRWEGGMWEYDAYHDSIITAGNGGTQPIQTRFTLFYNQGKKRYDMEQTLQPDGQMWVDVGQIIREQTPDKNGNTLPPALTTGSYEITDLSHHGAGTLFEGKVIYDKMYGDAAYGCALCCGYATIDYGFWYDPLGIPDLGTAPQGVQALDKCEDEYDDVSDSFYNSWTTGNSSVATADYYGTHTGTGLGSTTSNAHGELNENDVPRLCPLKGYNPSGGDNVANLTCSPYSVARGNSVTCTATGPSGATFSGWKFQDGSGNVVTSSSTSGTWSGQLVTGGTVSVIVHTSDGGQQTRSASVTVAARSWHTSPATPSEVPNGTFILLPVPPQPQGIDADLGYSKWYISDNGTSGITVSDGGPNDGFYYYTSFTITQSYFEYEINPDLENSGSTFSQHQCGNYDPNSNPSGFISWSNLLAQTGRHEYNSAIESHYAFYSNGLSSNNPGDYVESRVGSPGTSISTFDQDTRNQINSDYNAIASAASVEPYPVNYSETGAPLGNINYSPYTSCN